MDSLDSVKVISFARKVDKEDSVLWTETVMIDVEKVELEEEEEENPLEVYSSKRRKKSFSNMVDEDEDDSVLWTETGIIGGGEEEESDDDYDYGYRNRKRKRSRKRAKNVRFETVEAQNAKKIKKLRPCKVHLNGIYCKDCDCVFTTCKHLPDRLNLFKKNPFSCLKCDESFEFGINLMEHVSLKHSDMNQLWLDPSIVVPEEEKRFSCEICSKSFAFEESLSIHNENLHRPGTMSQVENGAKETGEKVPGVETDAIENAIIEPTEIGAKETIMAPTDIKMDSCEFDIENMDVIFDESCFDDNDLINGHDILEETPATEFSDPKLIAINSLLQNGVTVSIEKRTSFKCKHCEGTFPSKEDLENHVLRQHYCKKCMKFFETQSQFASHVRICGKKTRDEDWVPSKGYVKPLKKCLICGHTYHKNRDLKDHINHVHKKIKNYSCSYCAATFGLSSSMLSHHKIGCFRYENDADNKFKCDSCPKTFYTEQAKMDHVAFVHENRMSNSCQKCGAEFPFQILLQRHVCGQQVAVETLSKAKTDGKSSLRNCIECGNKTFKDHQMLVDHKAYFHDRLKTHQCTNCGLQFGYEASLRIHFQRSFSCADPSTICQFCNLILTSRQMVRKHQRRVHKDRLHELPQLHRVPPRPKPRSSVMEADHEIYCTKEELIQHCDQCPARYRSAKGLERHIKQFHLSTKTWSCQFCQEAFLKKSDMFQHRDAMHQDEKKFLCEMCSQTFWHEKYLQRHIRTYHVEGRESIPCSECDKVFINLTKLNYHVNTFHKRVKTFTCDLCHKVLLNSRYEDHLRSHLVDQDRTCDICWKKFPSPTHLQKHIASVHEEKQMAIKSEFCPNSFERAGHLEQHIKKVHKKPEKFQCDLCNLAFAQENGLKMHLKRIHNILSAEKTSVVDGLFDWSTTVQPVWSENVIVVEYDSAPTVSITALSSAMESGQF